MGEQKNPWDGKIPWGWRRVTRGNVREGDRLWSCPDKKFVAAPGDGSFGDAAASAYCCIRRVRGKAAPVPVKTAKTYILVEKNKGGVPLAEGLEAGYCNTVKGPFHSECQAKAWVQADAEEHYEPGAGGSPEDWGQDFVLCEVVGILRPVPKVTVTVSVNVEKREAK